MNNEEFLAEARSARVIDIAVRFTGVRPRIDEEAQQIVHIKQMQVERIYYAGDLRVDDFGKILQFMKERSTDYSTREQLLRLLEPNLRRLTGRVPFDTISRRYSRNILRVMKALELLDTECNMTIVGDRLLRYYINDKEKYHDYLSQLLLDRGGWVAILTVVEDIWKGRIYVYGRQALMETLKERLVEKKYIRGIWSPNSIIDNLVSLGLMKQWDSILKTHEVNWEKVYDILRRKVFL